MVSRYYRRQVLWDLLHLTAYSKVKTQGRMVVTAWHNSKTLKLQVVRKERYPYQVTYQVLRNLLSLSNQQLKLVNNKEREYSQNVICHYSDQTGKQAGEVVLNDAIFGIEPNQSVMFDVIISQRASLRQRNSAVKNRSAVSGGGRKYGVKKKTGH